MGNNKTLWIVMMTGLLAVYGAALVLILQGQTGHRLVLLSGIVLLAHVLELPLAFRAVKGRDAQPLRVIVATLLFGLLWWVPAQRGIFAVR